MSDWVDDDIKYIVSVFSGGEDGGIGFIRFANFINHFKAESAKGDKDAGTLVDILRHFAKMLRISQRED